MEGCIKHYMDMPYISVRNGIITDVNNLFLELSYFCSEDLMYKPLAFIWKDLMRISIDSGSINSSKEAYLFTKSLEARHVDISMEIHSGSNSITYTFLEKPESRLDNKFSFIEQYFSKGTIGLAIYSAPDLVLLKANQMSLSFLDKPYNEAVNSIGKKAAEIISGFRGSEIEGKWNNAAKAGEAYEIKEMAYEGFNRGTTYWNMKGVPIFEDGIIKYLVQTIEEITQSVLDRKKLERQGETIKEQKEELEAIIKIMSDALYIIDRNENMYLLNESAKGRFSKGSIYSFSDSINDNRFYHLDGREIPHEELPALRALRGEKVKNFKMIVSQPGREYVTRLTAEPVYDEDGSISKVIVCSHDITDLVNKERTLKEQKEQLEIIIENMSDGLCVVDKMGTFLRVNKEFNNFLGNNYKIEGIPWNVEDAVNSELHFYDENGEPLSPEELPMLRVLKGERIEQQKIMFRREDRETIIDVSATPIFSDKGEFLYGIILGHDITHVIEKKRLLNKQKEELEAIVENFDDAIFIYDKDNNYYMHNKAARDYFPSIKLQKYGDGYINTKYYDFDNREIPRKEMTIYKVQSGQVVRDDKIKMVQGDNVRFISVSGRPVYNPDGSIQLSILHSRDITKEVNRERIIREQQELLLKGEREKQEALKASIELKDEFLYLITHEFRTPMAVINSALQAIELMCREEITEKVGHYLKMIKQNTNRQLRLVNNLLDITRINSGSVRMNMSSFDIVHVVQTIVDSIQLYGQQKKVALNFSSTLEKKHVFSDEEKIERIMLNLLANALKFTPSERSINVILSEREYEGKSMIAISVQDEGIGIPEEKQKIIFERFGQVDSSLSRRAEGTGLGLYLVKLLVNAIEGEMILVSEVDRGSTFTVLLPDQEPADFSEIAAGNELDLELINSDDRVIESAIIEFSDIYL